MATVARSRLRAMLGIAVGYDPGLYYAGTTTSNGAADFTTLIDTGIPRYDTSRLVNKWVYIKIAGGTNDASGQSRRIASVSSSTVTFVTAFTVRIDTAVTYDVLSYDPLDMHNALQEAGRTINRYSPLWITPTETLVVDNLLLNSDFEGTYTGGLSASWSNQAGTPTQVTNRVKHGSNAQRSNSSSAVGGFHQDVILAAETHEWVGKTLVFGGHIFTTAANVARFRVSFDGGSTFTNGAFHRGQDEWEGPSRLEVRASIPADATTMRCHCGATGSTDATFDATYAYIDPINRYTVPTAFIFPSPHIVEQQDDPDKPNGNYSPLRYRNPPVAGRLLRLKGLGRLTVPTTDTGTVELDETRAELLIAEAAAILLRGSDDARGEARWLGRVAELKDAMGIGRKARSANKHEGWSIGDESGTSYLTLKDR